MGADFDDQAIKLVDKFCCLRGRARCDFDNIGQAVFAVSGVDALGAVAGEKIDIEEVAC